MNLLIIAFWIIVPSAVIAALVWAHYAERKRTEEFQKLAGELGMSFSENLSDGDAGGFAAMPLAQRGHSRKHRNAMTADSGELRLVVFDYGFTVGSGKNQKRCVQSVVMVTCPSEFFPAFSLSPESFFHRMADMLGFKDIDFDDDPEFSRRYLLKGPNETAIRELFTPDRRRAFLQWPKLTIEAAGHSFIFFEARNRRKIQEVREFMERGFAVYSVLKSDVQDA